MHPGGRPPLRIDVDDPALLAVAVHGRDQSAGYLVEHLIDRLDRDDVAWVLPRAPGGRWYDGLAADERTAHDPALERALDVVAAAGAGWPAARTVLIGFSQGGCVVAELLARRAGSCGGAAVLTGTLLGPDPGARAIEVDLAGVPVALGVGSGDAWAPVASVEGTRRALTTAGADTTLVVSDSADHVIHGADLDLVADLLDAVAARSSPGSARCRGDHQPPGRGH